jgi:hypothetical protein
MSIFSKITSAVKTFASYAEKELTKLVGAAPKIEAVAATVLKYVGPALQILVSAEAGSAAGAVVGSVVQEAQRDLIAASSLIYDFGATPTVGSVIAGVSKNLGTLLTDAHVTNPSSVDVVNKIVNNLDSLAAAIPVAVAAVSAAVASK